MSAIGQQIKKYRLSKSYTQETLGNMIGVTTQAVSKWERGSTPDAEILPLIADALGVSIDVLYGREDQDVKLILTKKLSNLPPDEAFRYAFGICWSFIMGLTGDEEFSKEFIDMLPGQSDAGKEIVPDYFAKLIRDDGMALARTSGDFGHFFLMTEPRDKSILSLMENMEALRSVFALFADRDLLKTVCYLYSMPNMPVTATLIAKAVGLDMPQVERCMKTICEYRLALPMKIATVDGEIDSYTVRRESCAVPLLCFADEIAKGNPHPVFNMIDREKPLL